MDWERPLKNPTRWGVGGRVRRESFTARRASAPFVQTIWAVRRARSQVVGAESSQVGGQDRLRLHLHFLPGVALANAVFQNKEPRDETTAWSGFDMGLERHLQHAAMLTYPSATGQRGQGGRATTLGGTSGMGAFRPACPPGRPRFSLFCR